ncbi:MAG: transporter substrate-binding domain-containing protein [Deinococcales bacterium]
MPKLKLARHWWVIGIGLSLLFLLRFLPPDTSLARLRQKGSINVCYPPNLKPLISYQRVGDKVEGIETSIIQSLAQSLDLRINWNLQRDWYRSIDPSAWGIRKGACDILVGGIVDSKASKGFFILSPAHLQSGWAMVGEMPQRRDEVGFWAPYFGLDVARFTATSYLDKARLNPYFLSDPDEALSMLKSRELKAVLTDSLTAAWLAEMTGLASWQIAELPSFGFSLATWKGNVTLRRAMLKSAKSYRPETQP